MSEYVGEYVVSLTAKTFTDLRFHRHEEIVRCRDCMYITVDQSEHDFREPVWCNFHRMDVKPDGFCAWAKRRRDR